MNSENVIPIKSQDITLGQNASKLSSGTQIMFKRDYVVSEKLLIKNNEVLQIVSNVGGTLTFRNFDGQHFSIGVGAKGSWYDTI
jgi:hypothetical protein